MKADINGHGWQGREPFTGSGISILKQHRRFLRKASRLFYTDQEKRGRCLHMIILSKHLGLDFEWMILLLIGLLLSGLQPKNVIGQSAVGKKSEKHYAPCVLGRSPQMQLLLLLLAFASLSAGELFPHFGHSVKLRGGKKAESCSFSLRKQLPEMGRECIFKY